MAEYVDLDPPEPDPIREALVALIAAAKPATGIMWSPIFRGDLLRAIKRGETALMPPTKETAK